MHIRHCLKLADRMHTLLTHELGQGLDRQRMLREPLYARDVLLVCDALRDTEAPLLAHYFRRAVTCPDEAEAEAARKRAGFNAVRILNTVFGPPAGLATRPAQAQALGHAR